jgi:O-antigen/teichoic acid export membrane protein
MSCSAFFRQSGWMMMAGVIMGVFMWAVHPILVKPVDQVSLGFLKSVAKRPFDHDEYSLFTTLLQIVGLMSIPAAGLQIVFAQQAAAAVTPEQERQLRRAVHAVLGGTLGIWLVGIAVAFLFRHQILGQLRITDPAALWLTILAGLPILWAPVLSGVLQGRQNFMWLGWMAILNGVGRCLAVVVIVRMVGSRVGGAMASVLLGVGAVLLLSLRQTRSVWRGQSDPVDWRLWLKRVLPLTVGLGASTFILSADMIVVRGLFPGDQTGLYGAAGIIGRALVYFTIPMAGVMFPKIVHSAARSERTDVLAQALGATTLLGVAAAVFCTAFPGLPLQLVYDKSYLVIKPLVPWFAWCMLPLPLANVLINNLLARERFRAVPWLVVVAAAYGLTLLALAPHYVELEYLAAFKRVVQILGAFSLLLLAVSAWFTWKKE